MKLARYVRDDIISASNIFKSVLQLLPAIIKMASQDGTKSIYTVVYNALATPRAEVIGIPVSNADASYSVERIVDISFGWEPISSTLVPNPNNANIADAAYGLLYFEASLLPIGASIFRISTVTALDSTDGQPLSGGSNPHLRANQPTARVDNDIVISNGIISVHCDQ